MSSQAKRENLVTEIKKIRKDIKRKHRALTGNVIMEQQELEKQFEPITQPLKKLINLHDLLQDSDVKMDDIETRLKKHKRRGDTIEEEITPIKNRKIDSLSDEPAMNTDEGETTIYKTGPLL